MIIKYRITRINCSSIRKVHSGALIILKTIMILVLLNIGLSSCKKLVEIPPPTNLIADNNVFTNDGTAIAALTGLYTNMTKSGGGFVFTGNNGIALFAGLSADEFKLFNGSTSIKHIAYFQNTLSVSATTGSEHWSPLYNFIFKCNAAIEQLNISTTLTPAVKKQLLGEAKFMRAFYYFYLTNLFGDVPLAVTTDYQVNSLLPRTAKEQVYQLIINDLKEAQDLLAANYLDGSLLKSTSERVRPTKWAAAALLARVYLYTGDFANSELQATSVINNSGMFSLLSLNNVFLKNSNEAIWQLQPTTTGRNTEDGWTFIIRSTGPSDANGTNGQPVYLSNSLLNSFELGDQRNITGNWVNNVIVGSTSYIYPNKYKSATLNAPVTEYLMVLRLGEQYLIRAEARAQQNNVAGAQADLNSIRTRAGLSNTTANDKASLLTAILHERQVELFTEWGHRWFDLKRTGKIDAVMTIETPLKTGGAPWKSYQQLYPIPLADIQKDPNLVQNTGY